ncbi:MAG TPA: hypothetical protein VFU36_04490 [Jatrophihabitans sp.]|nr:hypothetical protein [Jatrophihabitans sp.]
MPAAASSKAAATSTKAASGKTGLLRKLIKGKLARLDPWLSTVEERNISLWTNRADGKPLDLQDLELAPSEGTPNLPPLLEGTLYYDKSPVVEPSGQRSRVHALIGVGATWNGLADVVGAIYERVPGASYPSLGRPVIQSALLAYLRDVLPSSAVANWHAGLRLPLPIEVDYDTSGNVRLVLSGDKYIAWSSVSPGFTPSEADLKQPATPLLIFDGDSQIGKISQLISTTPDPNVLATDLAARLLVNPYEPVFDVIELMQQLRAADVQAHRAPADCVELAFVLAFANQPGYHMVDSGDPAKFAGWTSAGQAVLRRLWLRLGEVDPAVLDATRRAAYTTLQVRIAAALDLPADSTGAAVGPPDWAPGARAARVEPPLTRSLHELSKEQADSLDTALTGSWYAQHENQPGNHEMILGRYLRVGPVEKTGIYSGPALPGGMSLKDFWQQHPDALGSPIPAKTEAARKIIFAIAHNEGNLDGSRAADSGLISTGIQQWTIANNNEMTILLYGYKTLAPYHYDLFFGLHGLDVKVWGGAGAWDGREAALSPNTDLAHPNADLQKIMDSNVYWSGQKTSELGLSFPTYVAIDRIDLPGQQRSQLPIDPDGIEKASQPDSKFPRLAFFQGKRVPAGGGIRVELGWGWAARVRIAALCSVPYNVNQLRLAVFRMQRMVNEAEAAQVNGTQPGQQPATAARATWSFTELMNSEWAAAIAFDQHINRPKGQLHVDAVTTGNHKHPYIRSDQQKAIDRTLALPLPAYRTDAAGNKTDQLDEAWLQRFYANFLAVRQLFDGARWARNGSIVDLHDDKLSSQLGTAVYPRSDGPPKKAT